MVVTLDTNVLFQAFASSRGASHQIFRLVRNGELTMAISVPVFEEYYDVLSRDRNKRHLRLDEEEIGVVMDFIATVGKPTNISFAWRPNLKDESDNMIVELAVASQSQYLITRNIRDFSQDADLNNQDLRIVAPGEFLREWRQYHGR